MCFGKSTDSFRNHLHKFGYIPVRLPRANLAPMQILTTNGSNFCWLGHALDVLSVPPEVEPPLTEHEERTADVSDQQTDDLDIGFGLSLLGGLIESLGGSKIGMSAAYQGARLCQLSFSDVARDAVAPTKVDAFLSQATVNPNSLTIARLLEDDEVFIITDTIKTAHYTFAGKSAPGAKFEVDVPVIKALIGGNIEVAASSARATDITFGTGMPLVFGFKAIRLFYDNGRYTAFVPCAADDMTLGSASSARQPDQIQVLKTKKVFAD